MTHEAAHAKLDEFKSLEENWDSYGALPIKPEIFKAAHEFLDNMLADLEFPHVSPCNDGTVAFEWVEANRLLILELDTPMMMCYGSSDSTRQDKYETDIYPLADHARTLELIRWVCGGKTEE